MTDKYIQLGYTCECGERDSTGLQVICTDIFGQCEVLTITEGQADYIGFASGDYEAVVIDEEGYILAEFVLTIENTNPIPPPDSGEDKPDSSEDNNSSEDKQRHGYREEKKIPSNNLGFI